MKCPKCKKKMVLKSKDFSYNFDVKPKKKYLRKSYQCVNDDVWIKIETPEASNDLA